MGKRVYIAHPQDVLMTKSMIALLTKWSRGARDMELIIKSGRVNWSSFIGGLDI
jgi:hypothetical protein